MLSLEARTSPAFEARKANFPSTPWDHGVYLHLLLKEQIRRFLHICGGKFKTTERRMLRALGSGLTQENGIE